MQVERSEIPLAYHITWTTYGTWLPGDDRGWVDRSVDGVQRPDIGRNCLARNLMTEEPVALTPEQRDVLRRTIVDHCALRQWKLHSVNVRSSHVHVVLTADRPPDDVMNQLKSWCSRRLNERWPGRKKWWAYHGSTKWIWDTSYLDEAVDYVSNRQ